MALTLEGALRILAAGEAKARELGKSLSIAIVDTRGDLVAFHRMDGARWTTVSIARGKAFGAVAYNESTAILAERAGRPVFQALMIQEGGEMIFAQGGLPIREGDSPVGAIGVSGGATGQEDEDVAAAAIAAY